MFYAPHEIGTSPAVRRVQRLVEQSAKSDLPVLITGEVGAGKDLIAREIHRRSSRANGPLLKINCATFCSDVVENNAFNDADPSADAGRHSARSALRAAADAAQRSARSALRAAAGGTLVLEDIGDMRPSMQDNLLQLLREGEASPVGSVHIGAGADFRLITATHHDLMRAVETGAFNEDLYYRINLIHIHVPPLREHAEDIPALLKHFLQKHGNLEEWGREISADALARFQAHRWPGNIRELENAARRLAMLHDLDYVLAELETQDAPHLSHNGSAPASVRPPSVRPPDGHTVDLKVVGRRASEIAEREAILDMLACTMGNKKEAALRLGISYKALLYKIRDFGILRARPEQHDGAFPPPTDTSPPDA